jgi:hypothetical protein
MPKLLSLLIGCSLLAACNNQPAGTSGATTVDTAVITNVTKTSQSEIGDARYTDMGKRQMAKLSSGDVDGWANDFADNAIYRWSSGDSIVGKAAILAYWKERRGKVIDSISYSLDIWLPLKINKPQQGPDMAGNWLLSWSHVNVKYKNGKRLNFWIHTDAHYDANDKIDTYIQYIDRAPINRALGVR